MVLSLHLYETEQGASPMKHPILTSIILTSSLLSVLMASQLPAADQLGLIAQLNNTCQIPGQAVLRPHHLNPEQLVVEKCGSDQNGFSKKEFQNYLSIIKDRTNGLKTIRQLQLGNSFDEAENNINSIAKPTKFESTYKDYEILQDMVNIFNENSGMDLKLANLKYESSGHIAGAPFQLSPSVLKSLAAHNSRLIHKLKRIGCSKVGASIPRQLRFLRMRYQDGSDARLLVLSAKKLTEHQYEFQSYGALKTIHFQNGTATIQNQQIQFVQPISATQGLGLIRPFGWENSSDACYLEELVRSQK